MNWKEKISLISLVGSAIVIMLFIFAAFMSAGCAAPKAAIEPQSRFVFGVSRACDDGNAEITYSYEVMEVCATSVDGVTVYDVGCDRKNLEICDDEINYIVVGGTNKLHSRNCAVISDAKEKAVKAHKICLKEIMK